ncbi:MAG: NADH-quinone oxidoreductase subunit C [Gallionellaceae bacterium]|nr:NADH-quinone oxidoreductase subunit C [Gallionellaceae bacterium]
MKLAASPPNNVSASLEFLLQEIPGLRTKWAGPRRLRVDLPAETLPALLELLKGRAGYVHLSAISCVDWPTQNEFELVYHLWSYELNVLVMAHIRIPRDPGVYLSVYDLYHPAAFFERDIHEMFGLYFEGSPDMGKFILTEWDGPPPMRKEFDSEAWVMNQFEWQDYRPDWLAEIEAKGGGITTRPQDIRKDGKP